MLKSPTQLLLRSAALTLTALLPLSAAAQALRPYVATYETRHGLLSATGERRLDALPDGRWQLQHGARVLMVKVSESSTFVLQGGKVQSLSYEFVNPLSKDRSMALTFDWQKNTATDSARRETLQLQPGVFDKLGYQVQLQMDVCANPDGFTGENFTVADRGRLKTYRVERVGRQPLKTPAGMINTVQLRQFRPDKQDGNDTMIWLAPDWNCLLVRLDQHERDDTMSLTLVKATVGGVAVTGKR